VTWRVYVATAAVTVLLGTLCAWITATPAVALACLGVWLACIAAMRALGARQHPAHLASVERASELKTRFLANVSHELRTPLSSIVAYSEMLSDEVGGPLNDEQRKQVAVVRHNADHLLYLISDLLDISRIEAGHMRLTMGLVALGECLESAWRQVEPQITARGLAFEARVPEEPVWVAGNFNRLQQVFTNLLGNAVKFTEAGTVGVELRVDGSQAIVSVWDTGIGIPAENAEKIFEEFHQGDDSIHQRFGGSGLGLAICRRLVELHGGTVNYEPVAPHGSRFVVKFPVKRC